MSTTTLDARIERWQQNLLDLTLRNRMLNFKPGSSVQLIRPDSVSIFDRLTSSELSVTIREQPSENNEVTPPEAVVLANDEILATHSVKDTNAALRKMKIKSRGAIQEQGVNILFLAFGMVKWFDSDSSEAELLAPLVLVPVELSKPGPIHPFKLRAIEEEVVVNPTLTFKLSNDFGLDLPEWSDEDTLSSYLKKARDLLGPLKRWTVDDQVFLGLFSFAKLSMYKEMEAHREIIAQHPLLNAISGDPSFLSVTPEHPSADRLDREVRPAQSFQILDADSSQQEAIEMAKRGISFVLQGPPGTGKSQTIANIIAESLAMDRKVLFVSEKMTALEVVKRRLDEKGLGTFLFEIHSHKANKSAVIEELRRCVQPSPSSPTSVDDLNRLEKVRTDLNDYVQALHEARGPIGRSAFYIHGRLAALNDAAILPIPIRDIGTLRLEDLDGRSKLIKRVETLGQAIGRMDKHPWRDLRVEDWNPGDEVLVESTLRELGDRIDRVRDRSQELSDLGGCGRPNSPVELSRLIEGMRRASSTPFPPPAWLAKGEPERLLKEAEQVEGHYKRRAQLGTWLAQNYGDGVLSLDVNAMKGRFTGKYAGFLRFLNQRYRNDLAMLQGHSKSGQKKGYSEALADLDRITEFKELEARAGSVDAQGVGLFGDRFKGDRTDWGEVRSSILWTSHFLADFKDLMTDGMRTILCDRNGPALRLNGLAQEAREELSRLEAVQNEISNRFQLKDVISSVQAVSFDHFEDFAANHLAELESLREWIDISALEQACLKSGLEEVFALARKDGLPAGDLVRSYNKRAFHIWLETIYATDGRLRDFRSDEHRNNIELFRQLDERQMTIAQRRLTEKLSAGRTHCLNLQSGKGSELAILKHELEKKKRFKQVRQLFRECPNLILELKPCLLMSPLSVSNFLDPEQIRFDLVIFDEASQVRPEDAVGSIMRGGQTIVVGDSKQLPPTSFFQTTAGEDDEVEAEDLESILDECSAVGIGHHMLLWHYRSEHESLIAFSNRYIYDNRLYTFPSASRGEHGVSYVKVADGIYDRGGSRTNVAEARKVTELVFEHFTRTPQRSLGVIAFSESQQLAILDEIDRIRKERPEFEKYFEEGDNEEFFVKNLENVQGDQRDVIILDIGYARDRNGRMYQNFGPLNRAGGERRLNVAITRAKMQVKVVASIAAEDIEGTSGVGPRLLKDYLTYAASGGSRDVLLNGLERKNEADFDSPFEEEVYKALSAGGLRLQKQVGCSGYRIDLAVEGPRSPGTYILGIECDGASYHSGKTARDRDRLREKELKKLGWRIHRIWSRDWVLDRGKEVRKVMRVLGMADVATPGDGTPILPKAERVERDLAAGPVVLSHKTTESEDLAHLRPAILELVKNQGPVHLAVAKAYLRPVVNRPEIFDKIMTECLRTMVSEGEVSVREQFIWPAGVTRAPMRKHTGPIPKELDHVCLEEIGEVVLHSFRSEPELPRRSVINRTAFFYRHEKPSDRCRGRIERAIERLVSQGILLEKKDDVLRRADQMASGRFGESLPLSKLYKEGQY